MASDDHDVKDLDGSSLDDEHDEVNLGMVEQLSDNSNSGVVAEVTIAHPVMHNDPVCGEPAAKRQKTDIDSDISPDQSVKHILFNINKAICMRLDGIENSIEILNNRTKYLEEKVDLLFSSSKSPTVQSIGAGSGKKGAVIVGLPQNGMKTEMSGSSGLNSMDNSMPNLGPNVTLITLNTEEDFPSGTWLGEESNPEMRVRCPITPSDLLHIHSNCRTAEKMALTMLDYLFDRETQACSNLSGMGKHGKKQLDPLMIYGIRCHLIHRFGITEIDWHRIKQNVDSKCRTAFRRKQRGMSLNVKAFRGRGNNNSTYIQMGDRSASDIANSDEDSLQHDSEMHIQQGDIDIQHAVAMHGEGLPHGEIQILHATPEQISQLQHAQHIQILQGDSVIQVPVPQLQSNPDVQVAVSMQQHSGIHVETVTTEGGEVLQVQQNEES
ncbi:hypothetical protein ScPMuIL_000323 [Solemya velum]